MIFEKFLTYIKAVKALFKEKTGDAEIAVENLLGDAPPAVLTLSEEGRRLQEMTRMFGGGQNFDFPTQTRFVVNASHPLVTRLTALAAEGRTEDADRLASQIYDLARLAHAPLTAEEMTAFIKRSAEIMEIAAK